MSELINVRSELSVPQMVRLVGHELRNRLGVLSNSVYYLNLRLGQGDDKVQRHLGLLAQEIAASRRILANLMDWVGPKDPVPERLHIDVLVEQLLARNQPPQGVRVALNAAEGLPPVRADINHLERALTNIIAYEYELLGQEGSLRIVMCPEQQRVALLVEDSAPAFTPGQATKLADLLPDERFSPLHWGLELGRALLAANGCEFTVSGSSEHAWRFRILLPLA